MISKTLYSSILLFLFLSSSTALSAPTMIGTIKTLKGMVSVNEGASKINAQLNGHLYEGSIIETNSSSSVGLMFIDGTQLSIGPNSQVILNRYLFLPKEKSYDFDIMINNGSVIYSSGKLGELAPKSIKVKTPEAIIGVRGTKFLVEVD